MATLSCMIVWPERSALILPGMAAVVLEIAAQANALTSVQLQLEVWQHRPAALWPATAVAACSSLLASAEWMQGSMFTQRHIWFVLGW